MSILEVEDVAARFRDAANRVLDLTLRDRHPDVVVDSPPGAGKTWLVEQVVATAVHFGGRVAVVAPRAEQTYDLVRRLRRNYPQVPLEILLSS